MISGKKELTENWAVLIVAFLMIFFAFGVPTYSMPWMYGPAMKEFGWSNAEVNLLATAKFVIGAAAALGMGILVDKMGGRLAVLVGALSGGIALALFLFATKLPIYYLAGAMLGLSASSIVAAMKIVLSRLFTIHQGLAMGIVLSATSLGAIVMPLVWVPLLEVMNWRSIAALMSLGSFAIATPLWLIFMARSQHARSSLEAGKSAEGEDARLWPHFLEIIRDRGFLLIVAGIFLTSAVDQALMQNYVNFLRADKGIVLSSIAWAGSVMGAMGIVSRIGTGWFYDRFSISGIRFSYVLLAISIFLALPVTGAATLFLFIAVRGITHGGLIVEAPVLAKHYLGTKNIGMTIGVISVFINLGFAAGPPVLGAFADANGNFTLGLVVYGFTAVVGFLLLVPVRPRYWVPPAKRESAAIEAGAAGLQPAAVQPRH